MQEDSSRSPTYTVSCEDYVHVVEFSPFSSGTPASLLAYGGNQYVVVGTCLFQVRDAATHNLVYLKNYPVYYFLNTYFFSPQEEDMEIEGVEFNVLRAFHHELRVDALAWSPESRLDRIPIIRYWYLFPAPLRSGDIMSLPMCMLQDIMIVCLLA